MMKRLPLLFALVAVFTACQNDPPLVVTGAMGTYRYQITPGQPEAKLGTALVLKLRSGAARVGGNASVTVTGPGAWNDGKPLRFTYPAGSDWVLSPETDIPPVAGAYTITVNAAQERGNPTRSLTLTLENPSATLEFPVITLSDITRSSFNAAWTSIQDAKGYIARVFNGTDNVFIGAPQYLTATNTAFPAAGSSLDLSPNKNHLLVVNAANFDTVTDDPPLPAQINLSDSAEFIQQPQQLTTARSVKRGQQPGLIVKP
jgi:hypothetical protein